MEIFKVQHDMVYGIAKVCHEANRAFRSVMGQDPGPTWTQCTPEQQRITMLGVEFMLSDDRIAAADLHQNWVDDMTAQGWTHGPVKDTALKQHPCLVEYHELPAHEQYKDRLFASTVRALAYSPNHTEETPTDVVDLP